MVPLRPIPKRKDPGEFLVPVKIKGVLFREALCDTGANVNVMSKIVAEKLGLTNVTPSTTCFTLANNSVIPSNGFISDVMVQVGDCVAPVDFHVFDTGESSDCSLVLGRPFMATVGAVIDMPKKRIYLTRIAEGYYYPIVPLPIITRLNMVKERALEPEPEADFGSKNGELNVEAASVSDNDASTGEKKKSKVNLKTTKESPQVALPPQPPVQVANHSPIQAQRTRRVPRAKDLILIPKSFNEEGIEYRVKSKGGSKPFSTVRIPHTPSSEERGADFRKSAMSRVLRLKISEEDGCSIASISRVWQAA